MTTKPLDDPRDSNLIPTGAREERGYSAKNDRPPGVVGGEPAGFTVPDDAASAPSDADLMAAVLAKLTESRDLDASRIDVLVENGVLRLAGSVSSEREKRLAETLAGSVSGVGEVRNHLQSSPH